jgi:hypothetical protein
MVKNDNMNFALNVTLKIKLEGINKWYASAYQLLRILAVLPRFNFIKDLKVYWKALTPKVDRRKLEDIVDFLTQ